MKSIRVLVADDHESFRRSLLSFLRAQPGVEIVGEAADGVEAIDQAEKLHPDLVLMDLDMPGRDGFSATREIKLRLPGTKVVILSMNGSSLYRSMAWQHSADGFIDKYSLKHELLAFLYDEFSGREHVAAGVRVA